MRWNEVDGGGGEGGRKVKESNHENDHESKKEHSREICA